MKKPLQIVTLEDPAFKELLCRLTPTSLIGKIEYEEHTESFYALPYFLVIVDSTKENSVNISPCRSETEAKESAANYLLAARANGLPVILE
ncbi:MAG: hypothetical protein KDD62_05025 [Bdellovibrionales bacterium]|nr:hypothetical protein [Bdellovibrionales bacterium]